MIFFDRSVPRGIVDALKYVRDDVRWLEDEFPHATPDPVWLREVGNRGWLVITRDKKIRSRPGEQRALLENSVGCFCLTQGRDPTRWQYLKLIVGTHDEMLERFERTPRPFLYGVGRTGKFTLILPRATT